MLSLLRSRIFRVAGIGPVSMITGSTPTVVWSTILRGRAGRARPPSRAPSSSTAAAPSEICDELPAVITPSSLKAGLSSARPSTVVPGRMPWSVLTKPPFTATGTISRSNRPSAAARSARCCERAPISSSSSRGRFHCRRDHLGAEALVDQVVVVEQLGRERRADDVLELAPDEHRDPPHRLDARADRDVVDAARDQRRAEVDRLLGRAALTVDRRRRGLVGQSGLQPRVPADVERLLAVLLHAACEHVVDLRALDAGARQHLGVGRGEQRRQGARP